MEWMYRRSHEVETSNKPQCGLQANQPAAVVTSWQLLFFWDACPWCQPCEAFEAKSCEPLPVAAVAAANHPLFCTPKLCSTGLAANFELSLQKIRCWLKIQPRLGSVCSMQDIYQSDPCVDKFDLDPNCIWNSQRPQVNLRCNISHFQGQAGNCVAGCYEAWCRLRPGVPFEERLLVMTSGRKSESIVFQNNTYYNLLERSVGDHKVDVCLIESLHEQMTI